MWEETLLVRIGYKQAVGWVFGPVYLGINSMETNVHIRVIFALIHLMPLANWQVTGWCVAYPYTWSKQLSALQCDYLPVQWFSIRSLKSRTCVKWGLDHFRKSHALIARTPADGTLLSVIRSGTIPPRDCQVVRIMLGEMHQILSSTSQCEPEHFQVSFCFHW